LKSYVQYDLGFNKQLTTDAKGPFGLTLFYAAVAEERLDAPRDDRCPIAATAYSAAKRWVKPPVDSRPADEQRATARRA
jgi:hypothetical protein